MVLDFVGKACRANIMENNKEKKGKKKEKKEKNEEKMVVINEVDVNDYVSKSKLPTVDYVINPYIGCPHKCMYCYAEFMKRFTNHNEQWGDFLDVKRCDKKINVNKLADKSILFGSVTDAYNPFEKKYGNTREILKQFINSEVLVEILTKSDLVVRDIAIFKHIPHIKIGISMNTLDDTIRKKTEPYASDISKRINALKILKNEGIKTYIFLSPLFPGITDFKEIVQETMNYSDAFYFENLNLRGAYGPRVLKYINDYHSNLLPLYTDIYRLRNNQYWQETEQDIHNYFKDKNIMYGMYFYHEAIKKK
jgi:DNA repair photolyase